MNLGSPYFLLLTIGFALGCAWFIREGGRRDFKRVALIDICLGAIVGGVLGGRLLHVVAEPLPSYALSESEKEHALSDASELDPAGRAAVELALSQSETVPAAWLFIARMPAGSARDEAIEQVARDPANVPALLWYRARPAELPQFWKGGLAYLGGLGLAIALCLGVAFRHKVQIRSLADLGAPAIILGLVFGRLGCFLGGCCYGQTCEPAFWATAPSWYTLPAGTVARYPTALLSAGFAALLFFALKALLARRSFPGEVMLAMFALYAPGRFLIEALRADPRGGAGGLSTSQLGALATGIPALAVWVWLRLRVRSQKCEKTGENSPAGPLPGPG